MSEKEIACLPVTESCDITSKAEREALDAIKIVFQRMQCTFDSLFANMDEICAPHDPISVQSRLTEVIGRGVLANMEAKFLLEYGHLRIPDSRKSSAEDVLLFINNAMDIVNGCKRDSVYQLEVEENNLRE